MDLPADEAGSGADQPVATRPTPHWEPWDALTRVAAHRNQSAADLYESSRLSDIELARDPLA